MNKQKVALLVDSCTDVPKDFISKYNMYVIPLKVIYKDREYTDGVGISVAKVRGRNQSLQKAIDLATEFASTNKRYNIALVHGNAQEEADNLKKLLRAKLPHCNVCVEGQISPASGVHTGPGPIGIGLQFITD